MLFRSNMQNYVEPSADETRMTFMERMYKALANEPKRDKKIARRMWTNPVRVSPLRGG